MGTMYCITTKSGPFPSVTKPTFVETEEEALEQAKKWIKDMISGSIVSIERIEIDD